LLFVFDLFSYILSAALTVTHSTAVFLLKIGRRLLFRVIRLFDSAEALVYQIQEHTLGKVAELCHPMQHF
jgi:hypothetical protein